MDTGKNYMEQLLGITQKALREHTGINQAEAEEIQNQLITIGDKFTLGIIPANEAADIALNISFETLEYEIQAKKELGRLQEAQEEHSYSPAAGDFLNKLEAGKKAALLKIKPYGLEISALESLIAELTQLREIAWNLTTRIQDYSATAEYRDRRRAFLLTGEAPKEPAPNTHAPEANRGRAILRAWIDAGQVIQNGNGEYVTAGSPQDFCFWLNTQKANDIPPPETTAEILANPANLETWKRYYREAGMTKSALRG